MKEKKLCQYPMKKLHNEINIEKNKI